jgi:membrane protein
MRVPGWPLVREAALHWVEDRAPTIGAALAFYCAFSLAPLLVILVTLVGTIVGADVAFSYVGSVLRELFGADGADVLLDAIETSQNGESGVAIAVSVVTLVVGATTVFAALEAALEQIWGVRSEAPGGWRGFLRTRLLSFGIILAIGFLLLVSLSITTAITALRELIAERFKELVVVMGLVDLVLSLAMSTGLIAVIYRYLPARRLPWKRVLQGAFVTALLFHAGRWAIGLYLGNATQPSAFGAAASFVALLLWLYYSAQIFLFGAELTASLAGERGRAETAATPADIERA